MATMSEGSPHRYRFTAEEYLQMGAAGVLRPDARVELIEGEIIDMPPIGPPHAATVERLGDLLRHALANRAMVRTQQPSVVGMYSVPQPDITVVARRDDYYRHAHPEPHDVFLVVEVAATTLAFDRDVKTAMYARSGVPEVWVVDVAGQRIIRSASPRDGVFAESQIVRADESLSIAAVPELRINAGAVFSS